MGAVYVGRGGGGFLRAIKVPLFDGPESEDLRVRFEREARAMARLAPHPNVARIHGAGQDRGFAFCALELVVGEGLDRIVERGPLPVPRALEIAEEVARAVGHVHAHGVVHRDVKPANVIVRSDDGRAVLVDFGLALDVGEQERLTKTGTMVGTPAYMAPEQADGARDVDARVDVYAVGVLLYELLTGKKPFEAQEHRAAAKRLRALLARHGFK